MCDGDVRCVIVDDNPAFLHAAEVMLSRDGIAVVGTATCGARALDMVARVRPDVVLVDLCLGAESGLSLIGQITARAPEIACICISTYAAEDLGDIAGVPFLSKIALTSAAVRDIVRSRRDGDGAWV